jgi:hypothetical protein
MSDLTRRSFIKQASATAATVGAIATLPTIANAHASTTLSPSEVSTAAAHGPIIAHIRNLDLGEIALLVGEREIVIRDRVLVRRLVKAAQF